jgi:hypothetical protein
MDMGLDGIVTRTQETFWFGVLLNELKKALCEIKTYITF